MEDRSLEIFSQYDLNINNTYRVRGAWVLETDEGPKLLIACNSSESRLEFEDALKQQMRQNGYFNVDCFVRNAAGTISSTDSAGERFLIKDWFIGEECNIKKEDKIIKAVNNLASLHSVMEGIDCGGGLKPYHLQQKIPEVFDKRTKEMKRVMTYVRNRNIKSMFESSYLNMWDEFYDEALSAARMLKEIPFDMMYDCAVSSGCVCHGGYNQHNILIISHSGTGSKVMAADLSKGNQDIATTNFEKASFGLPVTDLYQFMRKVMEKTDWDIRIGKLMIEEYDSIRKMNYEEKHLLSILLTFPEKFWKITNFYYNSKKSWIPQKNIQKLLIIREQQDSKREFIRQIGF